MGDDVHLYGHRREPEAGEPSAPAAGTRLAEVQHEIERDWDRLRDQGIHLWKVSDDEAGGVVEVGVDPLTPEALAYFSDRYGDLVRVVREGPATQA